MFAEIATLFDKIKTDKWRETNNFSADLLSANNRLFEANSNKGTVIEIIKTWLQKYQPCLFGRLAAKLDLLSYCILFEDDLKNSAESLREKIQAARTEWTHEAFEGRKSGFIILVISPTIANAIPDDNLKQFAQNLCSLYLLDEIQPDVIYTDEIWLEIPGKSKMTLKWQAGVNYFCSNADGRWWQDHRIPGGMAFSVNSVGHMARSGGVARIINELYTVIENPEDKWIETKVKSLSQALEFAMRTIAMASETVSGKATELIPVKDSEIELKCPIELPKNLNGMNCRHYLGYYHTDITIPSEYFLSDIIRPNHFKHRELDFTYLFDDKIVNPDFVKMGQGRKVRASKFKSGNSSFNNKILKATPTVELIKKNGKLK